MPKIADIEKLTEIKAGLDRIERVRAFASAPSINPMGMGLMPINVVEEMRWLLPLAKFTDFMTKLQTEITARANEKEAELHAQLAALGVEK